MTIPDAWLSPTPGDLVQEFEQNLQLALSRVSLSRRSRHRQTPSQCKLVPSLRHLIDVRDVGMIERAAALAFCTTLHPILIAPAQPVKSSTQLCDQARSCARYTSPIPPRLT